MYELDGVKVSISPTAELIHRQFGGGDVVNPLYRELVQETLDELATDMHKNPIDWSRPVEFTLSGFDPLPLYVLELQPDEKVAWGHYRFHTARRRKQRSPFVARASGKTDSLTVELRGTMDQPKLVRVYAGLYTPPLPWQVSIGNDAKVAACRRFWLKHAFAYDRTIIRDPLVNSIPRWAM